MGVSISKLDPVKPLKVKSKLKKLKRFFIFFFLALILILSASIAFIRTDRGLNFVASKGASFLSSMGLKATWDKIEGPFPQKIVLSGLRLTDNLGEFLTAKQIHLEASPWKLLSREIKIDILEISGLDFKRRPIVPPPKPSSSSPAPKIFLNAKVIVTDSRLSPAVILPPGLNSSQDDIPIDSANNLVSPNSNITLDTYPPEQGRLSLRADLKFERGVLDFDFDFSWDDSPALTQGASNNGLYGLYGQGKLLQRYPANPDTLDFKVVAHNGPGGTLSLLMGQPDLPAWTLSLSGSGPVSSWSGNASMGLDLEQTGLAEASLNLSLPNGSVLKDLVEDPQLKLSLEAQGGPQAPLPEALIARLGQGLALNANLNLKEDSLYGFLTVLFPKAQLSVNSFKATNLKYNVNLMAAGVIAFDPAITLPAESSQNSEANQSENPLDSFLASAFDLALERRDDQFLIESFNLVSQGFSLKSSGLFKPVSLDSQASQVSQVSQDSQAGQVSQASDASDLSQALSQIEAKIELQTAQDSPWQKLFELVLNGPTLGDSSLSASLSWPKNDHLDLSAHFTAQNLGTLVSGWQGQIEADIAAKGPIDNLTSEIDLLSPALVGPFGQEFVDLTCDLRLLVSNLPDPPKALGTLSAAIKEKAGSPFEAKASLEVAPGPPFKAKVSDLKLQADSGKRLDLESPSLSLSLGAPFDIEGTVNLTINDWKTISEFTGLPITGAPAHLEASFLRDPKNNLSTATAKVEMPDFKFQNISLSDLKLNMLAEGLTDNPNLDLNMTLGPGRFSDISFSQGNLKAQAKDSQGSFSLDLKSTDAYELAHASGEIDLADKIINLVTLRADLPELPDKIALSKPAKISLDPLAIDDLHLIYGQKATISGSFNRQSSTAKVKVDNFPLETLSKFNSQIPPGLVNLDAQYAPDGQTSFDLKANIATPSQLEGLPKFLDITASGRLEAGGRDLVGSVSLIQAKEATLSYRLPMAKSGDWIAPDFGGHIMAHLAWKGSVAPIWSLIGLADRKLTGLLDLDLKVEGSINKPIPVVKMYLVNGSYEDLVTGIFLSGINLELTDSADQQLKLLLEAADHHDGSLALEGVIKPFDPTPNISLRGQFKNLSPLQRDDASITLTALVSLEGPLTGPAITAQAVVNNAEINLDNAKGSRSIRTLPVEDTAQVAASGPPLKVTIDMPRQIFIRGRGLDSEWSGHLSITGQTGQPLISGSLKPIRGTFDLLSKQFTLSGGDITFINSKSLNPILNLELTRQTPELTALVQVTGTVSRPHLLLQSQPPHPSDEVLSQVLFGKKVSSLSRVEALQLANSLRVMAGLGGDIGLTVLNSLRDTLGLSVLRVSDTSGGNSSRYLSGNSFRDNFNLDGSDSANTQDSATIEAGKYLSENVYVGVEQNLADNSTGVRVEVELTPSITLRGLSTSNSSRVGLGWKKDY